MPWIVAPDSCCARSWQPSRSPRPLCRRLPRCFCRPRCWHPRPHRRLPWPGRGRRRLRSGRPAPRPPRLLRYRRPHPVPAVPADNAWNTPVDQLPLDPDSATYIAHMSPGTGLHPDFGTVWDGAAIGIPYVVVRGAKPRSRSTSSSTAPRATLVRTRCPATRRWRARVVRAPTAIGTCSSLMRTTRSSTSSITPSGSRTARGTPVPAPSGT